MRRVVRSHLGSALRLSQPLSGLPADSSSTALFRAATVPGLPSFRSELSPRKRSRTSLEAAYSPAVIHRRAEDAPPETRHATPVSPTPAPPCSCLDPPRARAPFRRASPLPGRPGSRAALAAPFRQLHLLRSLRPSCESVLTATSYPATEADALLVTPLYSFLRSRLRPFDPLRPGDPRFGPRPRFPSDSDFRRGNRHPTKPHRRWPDG
jgi:hypothetical protein